MELEPIPIEKNKNVSYLYARDPSIFAGLVNLQPCRITYNDKNKKESLDVDEGGENLQVYLRIKKTANFDHLYNIVEDNRVLLCKPPKESYAMRNNRDQNVIKKFTFTKIFNAETSQLELFNEVVKGRVLNFINGKNCTILTYGASGSGKTFTIVGTDSEPGIIPRTLEYLFRTLPKLPELPTMKPEPNGKICKNIDSKTEAETRQKIIDAFRGTEEQNHHIRTYNKMKKRLSDEPAAILECSSKDVSLSVWVSFAEIYNECIYDLLQEEPPRGKKRTPLRLGKSNDNNYIKDLTYVHVRSGIEAYEILQYGLHNLKYAATNINSHSSRSHSIFSIKLAQASNTENGYNVSCFNFCDLAGSERVKKTHNVGDRLKESNNINTSLMILGRCIKCVRDSQKNGENKMIPFRESKLTQLFQNALLGQEDIRLIVNINPVPDMFDESQHVLNFSAIAKDIVIEPRKMVVRNGTRLSRYLQSRNEEFEIIEETDTENELEILREEVYRLTQELEVERKESDENEAQARKEVSSFYKKLMEEEKQMYKDEIRKLKALYERELQRRDDVITIDSSSDEDDDEKRELLKKNFDLEEKIKNLYREIRDLKSENEDMKALTNETIEELKKEQSKNYQYTYKISYLESKLTENETTMLANQLKIQKYENILMEHNIKFDEIDNSGEASDHESCQDYKTLHEDKKFDENPKKINLGEKGCEIEKKSNSEDCNLLNEDEKRDEEPKNTNSGEKENQFGEASNTRTSRQTWTFPLEKTFLKKSSATENCTENKELPHKNTGRFTTVLKPRNT